jgi:hypothetical protein
MAESRAAKALTGAAEAPAEVVKVAIDYVRSQLAQEPGLEGLAYVRPHVRVERSGVDYIIPTRPIIEEQGAQIVREVGERYYHGFHACCGYYCRVMDAQVLP